MGDSDPGSAPRGRACCCEARGLSPTAPPEAGRLADKPATVTPTPPTPVSLLGAYSAQTDRATLGRADADCPHLITPPHLVTRLAQPLSDRRPVPERGHPTHSGVHPRSRRRPCCLLPPRPRPTAGSQARRRSHRSSHKVRERKPRSPPPGSAATLPPSVPTPALISICLYRQTRAIQPCPLRNPPEVLAPLRR